MKVLVTGATGFIGRRAARRLVARGLDVRCLVRGTSDLSPLTKLPVEVWRGDVLDPASLAGAMEHVDAVVHLVGIIQERPPASTFRRLHVEGTANVVQAAREAGASSIVYVSALGARPDPRYPYLQTKWEAEELVRNCGLGSTVIRFSIVFGEGDQFMNRLAALVRRPPSGDRKLAPFVPVIGSGKTCFQPIYVEDAAECIALAAASDAQRGRTLELGGPERLTYEDLIDITMDTLAIHRPKVHVPVPLIRPAVALMPLIYRDPPLTKELLDMIEMDSIAEPGSVEKEFGFTPARIREKLGYIVEESR